MNDAMSNASNIHSVSPRKTVHMIRHGQSHYNVRKAQEVRTGNVYTTTVMQVDQDATLWDAGLTDEGRQQAETLRRRLVEALTPLPEVVLVSPLTRALQTASIVFQDYHPYHFDHTSGKMVPEELDAADKTGVSESNLPRDRDSQVWHTSVLSKAAADKSEQNASNSAVRDDEVLASELSSASHAAKGGTNKLHFEVHADIRELLNATCDIGREPEDLAQSFPHLSFAHLERVWWENEHIAVGNSASTSLDHFVKTGGAEPLDKLDRRIDRFLGHVRERTEQSVAIVAHADLIKRMAERITGKPQSGWLRNCGVLTLQL